MAAREDVIIDYRFLLNSEPGNQNKHLFLFEYVQETRRANQDERKHGWNGLVSIRSCLYYLVYTICLVCDSIVVVASSSRNDPEYPRNNAPA